ncbi:MAG: 3-phosphoshikimate 1-carboxyvinyltransferase [Acholeplasmataceae bacterium]|nr:3-phosphoshikimate 1-carboxyvinyltransferase [Acholeplasmataceae bacterium]
MKITINPTKLKGMLQVVSSKSLSHRYIIAAGLANGTSIIKNALESDDLTATRNALQSLGVAFDQNKVIGSELKVVQNIIDCMESGSTLRFMIPISMLLRDEITFIGQGRLPLRPLDVYFDIFNQKHLFYKKENDEFNLPLTVRGPLKPGFYQMRGDVSSQFLTGMLFALPLLRKDSVIEMTTPIESKGYVDLTLDVLKTFGIHILSVDQYFYIKGNQSYIPKEATVEGDFSQAAFWMVAGLIGDEITLKSLNPISKQGDAKIIDIIKEMHGDIEYNDRERFYKIEPSETYGTMIDLSQIPDLGPILMVLASLSKGSTKFVGCSRLRMKESDRLDVMYQVLTKLGVHMEIDGDEAVIHGQESFIGNLELDSFGDHRIAMAIAVAAIRADGPITINHAEVVSKSYPNFFEIYKELGGQINES